MNFWESKLNSIFLCPKHNILMGYKYKVNHDYFKEINDEYKAYILGFIYADGGITIPSNNRQSYIRIEIQEEDGYILNKFAKEAGGREVSIINRPSSIIKNWKKKAQITITSNSICNDLRTYGCNPNKSRVGMTFPKLKEELIPHFIRGFMDGDGSIIIKKLNYKYKRKTNYKIPNPHKQQYKLKVAFSSTDKVFLEEIAKYLPVKKFYIAERKRNMIVYTLWIENSQDVQDCLNYLYKDSNYFLKRKHDKFLEFNMTIKSEAEDTSSERLETT
jgi:hypothetical protein